MSVEDDPIERLLRGYRLPEVSPALDRRVLSDGAAILSHARGESTVEDLGRTLLDRLGFGYLTWLVDLFTTTDAEYHVEFI